MKILWLTVDRSKRVADIFGPLQRETEKIADVRFVVRAQWQPGKYDRTLPAIVEDWDCDVIFTDAPFAYPNESWPAGVPKTCLIEDQHGPNVKGYVDDCRASGFDLFLARYPGIERFHPDLPPTAWFPHSVDAGLFHPSSMGNSKQYSRDQGRVEFPIEGFQTLMTGRINPTIYPIRAWIDREMTRPHSRAKEIYTRIDRPPEGTDDPFPAGIYYADYLRNARIAFACTSCYHYTLLKLFEIPACGTVLVCDFIPELRSLGFTPGLNMLTIEPQTDLLQQVEAHLARKDLDDIAVAGADLIAERHTAAIRAPQLVAHLESLL